MSEYLPIVVAAPPEARAQLQQKNILPQQLFRNLATESLWEDHSEPAIYLWPYDIPYAGSDRFRDEVTERVGDLPAFFGMDPAEEKYHQERMLARVLFGSIIVHVIFLDNQKDVKERNESYAKFCSFGDIIQWSRNLKKVMEVRLLNNESNSRHILVIVSSNQQVITTQEELDALNECIGESFSDAIKPFQACYFMDFNLNPGKSKKMIHSKYVWDVQVSRLLLALLLSQEKVETDDESSGASPSPLYDFTGVKVWRAEDCIFSTDKVRMQEILKGTLESASKTLMSQTSDQKKWVQLEQDVKLDHNGLTQPLEPNWNGENEEIMSGWREDAARTLSVRNCLRMMFYNWADIPTETLHHELSSSEHWKKSFEERKSQRVSWSRKNRPKDYTSSVSNFFSALKSKPGILSGFIKRMYDIILKKHESQESEREQFWAEIADLEKSRISSSEKAEKDSKEFKKAQDYYVGRGPAVLVMMSVTLFLGWAIWQTSSVFGVGILTVLSLAGLVFAGSFVACFLVIVLHNFTGNRAANELVREYDTIDKFMIKRDEKVKEMFFRGAETRDVLALQNVRFRTLRLAKRVLSVLETELQPKLSSLTDDKGTAESNLPKIDAVRDPDGVRDAFLKMTRVQRGPFSPNTEKFDQNKIIESFFLDGKDGSFPAVWEGISAYDTENAGYYPARILVSQLRAFVRRFFRGVCEALMKSIDIESDADEALKNFVKEKKTGVAEKDLLSASLKDYYKGRTSYLFYSSLFKNPEDDVISGSEFHTFPSKELGNTTIMALFYQEYCVRFALKPIEGSKEKDSGQLTFEVNDEKEMGGK